MRRRAQDEALAGDGGRGHDHFVERVGVEEFVVAAGLDHVRVAVFAGDEDLAVVGPGAGGEGDGAFAEADFVVDERAGAGIVGGEEEDGALLGWLTGTEGTL